MEVLYQIYARCTPPPDLSAPKNQRRLLEIRQRQGATFDRSLRETALQFETHYLPYPGFVPARTAASKLGLRWIAGLPGQADTEELQRHRAECDRLAAELDAAHAQQAAATKNAQTHDHGTADHLAELTAQLEAELADLRGQVADAHQLHEELRAEVFRLEELYIHSQEDVASMQRVLEGARAELTRAVADAAQLKTQLADAEAAAAAAAQRQGELETALAHTAVTVAELRTQLDVERAAGEASLERAAAAAADRLRQVLEASQEQLDAQRADARLQLEALQSRLHEAQERHAAEKVAWLADAERERTANDSVLAAAVHRGQALEAQLAQLSLAHERSVAAHTVLEQRLRDVEDAAAAAAKQAQGERERLNGTVETLQRRLAEAEAATQRAQADAQRAAAELENAHTARATAEQRLAAAAAEAATLAQRATELEGRLQTAEHERGEQAARAQAAEADLQTLGAEHAALLDQVAGLSNTVARLTAEVADRDTMLIKLEAAAAAAHEQYENLQTSVELARRARASRQEAASAQALRLFEVASATSSAQRPGPQPRSRHGSESSSLLSTPAAAMTHAPLAPSTQPVPARGLEWLITPLPLRSVARYSFMPTVANVAPPLLSTRRAAQHLDLVETPDTAWTFRTALDRAEDTTPSAKSLLHDASVLVSGSGSDKGKMLATHDIYVDPSPQSTDATSDSGMSFLLDGDADGPFGVASPAARSHGTQSAFVTPGSSHGGGPGAEPITPPRRTPQGQSVSAPTSTSRSQLAEQTPARTDASPTRPLPLSPALAPEATTVAPPLPAGAAGVTDADAPSWPSEQDAAALAAAAAAAAEAISAAAATAGHIRPYTPPSAPRYGRRTVGAGSSAPGTSSPSPDAPATPAGWGLFPWMPYDNHHNSRRYRSRTDSPGMIMPSAELLLYGADSR